MNDKLLPLNEAIEAAGRFMKSSPKGVSGKILIPPVVFQYWDRQPPGEVVTLLERNRKLCQINHIGYCFFDDLYAKEFISKKFAPDVVKAYENSPHPAMKSDLFRLCFLLEKGGFYLDADMVLRDEFFKLFSIEGEFAVFKWDSHDRTNICNWLIGASPKSEMTRFVLDSTVKSIISACERDRNQALKNILAVSGPGLLTRAVGTYISNREITETSGEARLPITINSVEYAYSLVQNGPEYLKRPLVYKSTELHWLVAAKNR